MTTTEIARQDDHAVIVPSRPKAGTAAAAMDMLREHAEMMSMAFELAKNMVCTTMVPKIYQRKNDKDTAAAQNATAAILYGLELGLNPIQSLQQVFSVNNSPSIYARTMVALLKSKGYKFRTDESGPERCTVSGWWPGEDPETSTWDIERADKAGFIPKIDPATGKYKTKKFSGPNGNYEKLIGNEKYITQPEEMLWAKAASTVCRRLAPDVLLGIAHTVEDLESEPEPEPVQVKSERVSVAQLAQAAAAEGPKVQQWQPPADRADDPESTEDTSEDAAKPEDVQVEESAKASPKPAAEKPATTRAQPKAEAAAQQETHAPPSDQQIKELKGALVAEGRKTARQQVEYLSEQFHRHIGALFDVTAKEAAELTHFLMTASRDEADGDAQLPMNGGE